MPATGEAADGASFPLVVFHVVCGDCSRLDFFLWLTSVNPSTSTMALVKDGVGQVTGPPYLPLRDEPGGAPCTLCAAEEEELQRKSGGLTDVCFVSAVFRFTVMRRPLEEPDRVDGGTADTLCPSIGSVGDR